MKIINVNEYEINVLNVWERFKRYEIFVVKYIIWRVGGKIWKNLGLDRMNGIEMGSYG